LVVVVPLHELRNVIVNKVVLEDTDKVGGVVVNNVVDHLDVVVVHARQVLRVQVLFNKPVRPLAAPAERTSLLRRHEVRLDRLLYY
jgi:hypothetical protein